MSAVRKSDRDRSRYQCYWRPADHHTIDGKKVQGAHALGNGFMLYWCRHAGVRWPVLEALGHLALSYWYRLVLRHADTRMVAPRLAVVFAPNLAVVRTSGSRRAVL